MQNQYAYIVTPKDGDRYKNEVTFDSGQKFIVNTDIFNHKHVTREAIVLAVPSQVDTPVKVGDTVIVHHNLFRRWHDQYGRERNSGDYIDEDKYLCYQDQIYMYKSDSTWKGLGEYCFISPIENTQFFDIEEEERQVGVIEVANEQLECMGLKVGDVIGFFKNREYEFWVEGKRIYRMRNVDLFIKYDDRENVKIYNPEWVSHF